MRTGVKARQSVLREGLQDGRTAPGAASSCYGFSWQERRHCEQGCAGSIRDSQPSSLQAKKGRQHTATDKYAADAHALNPSAHALMGTRQPRSKAAQQPGSKPASQSPTHPASIQPASQPAATGTELTVPAKAQRAHAENKQLMGAGPLLGRWLSPHIVSRTRIDSASPTSQPLVLSCHSIKHAARFACRRAVQPKCAPCRWVMAAGGHRATGTAERA